MSAVLPRFLKFAGVGAIATAIQYGVLVASVELLGVGPVSGSCAGFLVGAVFNYWANYHFTFGSDNPHWVAASRFAVTAGIGLALNFVMMALLVHHTPLPYILSQVITTLLVLAWNFTVNSRWSFASAQPVQALEKGGK